MSVYYLTTATSCYHVVEGPASPISGGPVLCGRRLRNYGTLEPVTRSGDLLESPYMCRRCKAMYKRRREAVRA